MSLVTERIENNVLYLELNGRIDSSNADQAEELIKAIKEAHPSLQIVLDAENLEYLSSAGLRVVLRMRKDAADLKIINVSTEVYEILDMTGFTDMINTSLLRLAIFGAMMVYAFWLSDKKKSYLIFVVNLLEDPISTTETSLSLMPAK